MLGWIVVALLIGLPSAAILLGNSPAARRWADEREVRWRVERMRKAREREALRELIEREERRRPRTAEDDLFLARLQTERAKLDRELSGT